MGSDSRQRLDRYLIAFAVLLIHNETLLIALLSAAAAHRATGSAQPAAMSMTRRVGLSRTVTRNPGLSVRVPIAD